MASSTKNKTYVLKAGHGLAEGTEGTLKGGYFTFTNGSVKLSVKDSHILKFAHPKGT